MFIADIRLDHHDPPVADGIDDPPILQHECFDVVTISTPRCGEVDQHRPSARSGGGDEIDAVRLPLERPGRDFNRAQQ